MRFAYKVGRQVDWGLNVAFSKIYSINIKDSYLSNNKILNNKSQNPVTLGEETTTPVSGRRTQERSEGHGNSGIRETLTLKKKMKALGEGTITPSPGKRTHGSGIRTKGVNNHKSINQLK